MNTLEGMDRLLERCFQVITFHGIFKRFSIVFRYDGYLDIKIITCMSLAAREALGFGSIGCAKP